MTTKTKRPDTRALTGKQEAFAAEYVTNGCNATAAYRKVYNTSAPDAVVNVDAHRTLTNPKVALRVEQIRAKIAARTETKVAVTVESLTNKLEAALQKAMDEGKGASAAVSAVMGIAKLHGLITDKAEMRMTLTSHEERLRKLKFDAIQQATNGHAHQ